MKTTIQTFKYFLLMTLVLGVAYPIVMTGVAQLLFPDQANGSFLKIGDKTIGSALIAQSFKDPKYFWPRPSSIDYNSTSSGGSNLGPTSADLRTKIEDKKKQGLENDLLFSSGSGLDPHVSPESAAVQMERVAKARSFDGNQRKMLSNIVEMNTECRQFGFLGEPRVNVLKINISLDSM